MHAPVLLIPYRVYGKPHLARDLMAIEAFGIAQQHDLLALFGQAIYNFVYLP